MLMDVVTTCSDAGLTNILALFQKIILIIQIIAPIVLIITSILQFINLIMDPEKKGGLKSVVNKVLAAIIVLIMPFIMNVAMNVMGQSTKFSDCWNAARQPNNSPSYVDPNGGSSRSTINP